MRTKGMEGVWWRVDQLVDPLVDPSLLVHRVMGMVMVTDMVTATDKVMVTEPGKALVKEMGTVLWLVVDWQQVPPVRISHPPVDSPILV